MKLRKRLIFFHVSQNKINYSRSLSLKPIFYLEGNNIYTYTSECPWFVNIILWKTVQS